jgi:methylthioribose-1-phosphate isomerase
VRTIDWVDGAVVLIDQTALPLRERWLRISTVDDLVDAIRRLAVRGAPALGVAGALGVALAARQYAGDPPGYAGAVDRLATARPTAVNLARGVARADAAARADTRTGPTAQPDTRTGPAANPDTRTGPTSPDPDAALAAALALRDEEIAASRAMADRGADLVADLCGPGVRVLTHCNTGGLATVTGGTALAVVVELHRRGALAEVVASETRPLLQGARLTAWELDRHGIAYRVAVDAAGPFLMARGGVDAVLVGADRVCANGDVVNKVGTYAHALGARAAGIPFVVVAPESTVDDATRTGADVHVEDRAAAEVLGFGGVAVTPAGAAAVNPAFDITPYHLVTAIVTDRRVIRPAT